MSAGSLAFGLVLFEAFDLVEDDVLALLFVIELRGEFFELGDDAGGIVGKNAAMREAEGLNLLGEGALAVGEDIGLLGQLRAIGICEFIDAVVNEGGDFFSQAADAGFGERVAWRVCSERKHFAAAVGFGGEPHSGRRGIALEMLGGRLEGGVAGRE